MESSEPYGSEPHGSREDRLHWATDKATRPDVKAYERPALVALGSVQDLTLHHQDWHHHGDSHHRGGFHHHGSI